ncbi:Hypothetical protein IALB_2443 [Ignavibacterium album JCM 16511]|uniref:Uncharacterized protein n=1 Tax=Ignavibacterium album (strain DSM 19864 / JCM 16511 / NBRC 101810 / Mat9-16) TaxID=945713 RepID=I0AMD9_IGNAJ|nr:Hypothetical protein IALB_2443 [Ignavibacterium album JCM 16511]
MFSPKNNNWVETRIFFHQFLIPDLNVGAIEKIIDKYYWNKKPRASARG